MKISILDFLDKYDTPQDLTPAFVRASSALKNGQTLILPEGQWNLCLPFAKTTYLAITNHDLRHRSVALHLKNLRDVRIDGNGCRLLSEGSLCPFIFENCEGLVIEKLTLSRFKSLSIAGTVIASDAKTIEVEIHPSFQNWGAWAGQLFIGAGDSKHRVESLFEWDSQTRAPAMGSADNLGDWGNAWLFESPKPGIVRVHGTSRHRPKLGNVLMFRTLIRPAPALTLSHCKDVTIEQVRIESAGGMGIIAQRCRDVQVVACSTGPSSEGAGIYADLDDATHFCNCAGNILIEACTFEGQLDDASNIHGAWFPVERVIDAHTLLVKRNHLQQAGAPIGTEGDIFAIHAKNSLQELGQIQLSKIEELNSFYALLTFSEPLPTAVACGDVLDNISWHPSAIIRKNIIRKNRARGLLLSSRNPMLVEDNHFEVLGSAIYAGGGLDSWCESGPVKSLTIKNNRFIRCATEPAWGEAVIQCGLSDGTPQQSTVPFHQGISIENNTFELAKNTLALYASSCGTIHWHDNSGATDATRLVQGTVLE